MDKPWRDESTLRETYKKYKSTIKAGEELDCSTSTICRWMDRFGIEKIDRSTHVSISQHPKGYEQFVVNVNGNTKSVLHHRLILVAEHGIEAVEGKDTHHLNHIPWDNRPSNLKLIGHSDHAAKHNEEMERDDGGRFCSTSA